MTEAHTGNELKLMLNGEKPLSMFYYCKAVGDKEMLPIDDFSPYVQEGRIVMEEFDAPLPSDADPKYRLTYVLYALVHEKWRISAMTVALTAQSDNIQKPDEGIDRIIGLLLGYPKPEIEAWIRSGVDKGVYNKNYK